MLRFLKKIRNAYIDMKISKKLLLMYVCLGREKVA